MSECQERQAGVFSNIYEKNLWQGESRSGTGSNLAVTEDIRKNLTSLFKELNIKSIVDAPCGDANWMSVISPEIERYIGLDIVPALIESNIETYKNTNMEFGVSDLTEARLPEADMVFCRDCLVHLPLEFGIKAIRNFCRNDFRFIAMTTFPEWEQNIQSGIGGWRPINLELAPYSLPSPLTTLRDRKEDVGDRFNSKSIGVWEASVLKKHLSCHGM